MFVPGTDLAEDEVGQELLRRISSGHRLEVWRLRMPVHTDLAGVPHATGTVERLLVASGRLTAGPTDSPRLLGAGDLLAFGGDAPIYRTDAESVDGREHSSTGHARPAYYDYPGRRISSGTANCRSGWLHIPSRFPQNSVTAEPTTESLRGATPTR
ncbi:hypothetical protein [Streptomyces sp. NPDC056291]|uniref:hypothetical protein n=1 Tax=unclassified Streptomyces TaxID=2593676 RepID=UPI0035E12E1D